MNTNMTGFFDLAFLCLEKSSLIGRINVYISFVVGIRLFATENKRNSTVYGEDRSEEKNEWNEGRKRMLDGNVDDTTQKTRTSQKIVALPI